MMLDTFKFIVDMGRDTGPAFAFMVVGLAASIAIPVVSRTISKRVQVRDQLQAETQVEMRKLDISVKNGAVPARME